MALKLLFGLNLAACYYPTSSGLNLIRITDAEKKATNKTTATSAKVVICLDFSVKTLTTTMPNGIKQPV